MNTYAVALVILSLLAITFFGWMLFVPNTVWKHLRRAATSLAEQYERILNADGSIDFRITPKSNWLDQDPDFEILRQETVFLIDLFVLGISAPLTGISCLIIKPSNLLWGVVSGIGLYLIFGFLILFAGLAWLPRGLEFILRFPVGFLRVTIDRSEIHSLLRWVIVSGGVVGILYIYRFWIVMILTITLILEIKIIRRYYTSWGREPISDTDTEVDDETEGEDWGERRS